MIIFIYIILFIFNINFNTFLIEDFKYYNGEYVVYTNECYLDYLQDVNITSNYLGQVYKTSISNYNKVLLNVKALSSETIILTNIDIEKVLNETNAKIIEKVCVMEGLTLYNCYSPKYKKYVLSNNQKINIQIAISNNAVNIGYPVLIDY